MPPPPQFLTLWRFRDGKPGHEKQTLGLCNALARLTPCQVFDLAIDAGSPPLWHWLGKRFPCGQNLPAPDLLIGAGHGTHLPLLAARRARGGRIVLLMGPSLPMAWFDLCLIPEHDTPPKRPNVIITQGALNNVLPGTAHDPARGLILIGGTSAHFHWDSASIARQVNELVTQKPDMHWILTTSRRTPGDFLNSVDRTRIQCHPAQATPPGWLETELDLAGETWATPDSVSMVFEAMTSGTRVGILNLAPVKGSRVAQGILHLASAGRVASYPDLAARAVPAFNEADRCARLLIGRWFV